MSKYQKLSNNEKITNAMRKLADQVIEAIKNGKGAVWLKPWNGEKTQNIFGEKPYRRSNKMMTEIYNLCHGYTSQYFITVNKLFKLAKERGEFFELDNKKRSLTIFNYSPVFGVDENTGEEIVKYFSFNQYTCYNIEQVKGWKEIFASELEKFADKNVGQDNKELPKVGQFYDNFIKGHNLELIHGGDKACYIPKIHKMKMPHLTSFVSSESYYQTLGHECIHATGIELKRFNAEDNTQFGSDVYSEEELVAEFGAVTLAKMLRYSTDFTEKNSEAYLSGWASAFKNNPTIIYEAFKKAEKAVELIESFSIK